MLACEIGATTAMQSRGCGGTAVRTANLPCVRIKTAMHALGLGAATGLRTMAAPAVVFRGAPWHGLLVLGAVGELVVDKLPATPSRTRPIGLIGRSIAAAAAAGAYAARNGGHAATGGILGAAGALASAYLGAAYRSAVATAGIPDFPAALFEDTVAYMTAFSLAH
jgi:uncharacterized membrane protein